MSRRRKTIWALLCLALATPLMGQDDAGCATEIESGADNGGNGGGPPKRAQLGDAITLEGQDSRMRVTAIDVLDPAPVGEFDQPQGNGRFVGVQMRLQNVGDTPYQDSPLNGATLILADDSRAMSTIVTGGPCASGFESDVRISPGSRQQGCIAFEVPGGARVKTFQFGLDSGFGPETGEWRLRR